MNDFIKNGVLDVVDQWEFITKELNEHNQCGFCWKFYAPYTSKRANIIKDDGDCCVNIILTRQSSNAFGSNLNFNKDKGYYERIEHFETYTLDFVIASKEGINNYNELFPNNIKTSRHAEIFNPLRDCISGSLIMKYCWHAPVTNWSGQYLFDQEDEMFYGLRINITQKYHE